jgi:hypothetical protein
MFHIEQAMQTTKAMKGIGICLVCCYKSPNYKDQYGRNHGANALLGEPIETKTFAIQQKE